MSLEMMIIAYFTIETLLMCLAWGSFGYILFRAIGIREKHWYFDCLLVFGVLVLWTYFTDSLVTRVDLRIANPEAIRLLGYDVFDLWETTYVDIIHAGAVVLLGYMFGRFVWRRLIPRRLKGL